MAPIHLQKRRNDYLESPNRNRRCMESRKHTIADEHLRSHYVEPDRPASMLGSTINVVSSWFNVLTTSVSIPTSPSHNQRPSPARTKLKPRRISTNGTTISPTRAAQIPLPPSPADYQSLPFQNLERHPTLSSPSGRRSLGPRASVTRSPTLSQSAAHSVASSHSPRRGNSTAQVNGVTKPYKRRHIRHHQHQLEVKERLKQELFALKTSAGQSAAEVKAYINYAEKIDRIDAAGGVFAASKHLPPQRQINLTVSQRLDADQLDLGSEFLRKAIKRANDTLNSTRIPNNFPQYLDEFKSLFKQSTKQGLPEALSSEDQAEVSAALSKRGTVAKFAREQVTDADIVRLKPGQWLNDEVINFYGALILARSEEAQKGKSKALDVHYFNTFFFAKLEDLGYEKARIGKWTKKIDIFKKDVVLIPVNLGNAHWTCAAINFRKKRIEYHDSMGRKRGKVYKYLRDYLSKEHKDKKKKDFDFTGWEDYFDDNAPQQENGYDCGVFSCQYMECLSRGADFDFDQTNMPYLRQRMILEIVRGKLWEQ
ncbi:Ulp1 peptidase [Ceratobasidium theobromae]|uniref:Ulp1 peptidase n=1 Tax=Ceratobasidium theobromae TaxID=1582974 RepID=A0A5N5QS95_9AGAM|nr:Ulp1 peptidase [Ceratobasidium theobromae]